MKYCTVADVRSLHSIIPADQDDIIDKMIVKASAIVTSLLKTVFVDTPDSPAIVKSITEEIALYFVVKKLYSDNTSSAPEWITENYEKSLSLLEEIIAGKADVFDKDNNKVVVLQRRIKSTTEEAIKIFSLLPEWAWGRVFPEDFYRYDATR